jgi:tetratricopeptide (TPR) repeat protein
MLTKQHAWMHVLFGNELAAAGEDAKAEQMYFDGINMPKSYGEAKTFFNQEAHIYYYLGQLFEKQGKDAKGAYEEAAVYKAAVSELSLFRALALRKLSRFDEARAVLEEMLASAESFIENCDRRTYYGVGSPSPMPFEDDIVKNNLMSGYTLGAYALLGLGKRNEAEAYIDKAKAIFRHDFRVYAFDAIKDTVK